MRDPASSTPVRGHSPHGRGSIEIDFPDLEQDAHSDYSLGDLSPIKLVYAGGNPRSSPPPAHPGSYNGQSRPGEFISGGTDSMVSNPFYVIRSARKMFESCKYLLPCLRGMDVCSVHISEFGHIRGYKGQVSYAYTRIEVSVPTKAVLKLLFFSSRLKKLCSRISRLRRDVSRQLFALSVVVSTQRE